MGGGNGQGADSDSVENGDAANSGGTLFTSNNTDSTNITTSNWDINVNTNTDIPIGSGMWVGAGGGGAGYYYYWDSGSWYWSGGNGDDGACIILFNAPGLTSQELSSATDTYNAGYSIPPTINSSPKLNYSSTTLALSCPDGGYNVSQSYIYVYDTTNEEMGYLMNGQSLGNIIGPSETDSGVMVFTEPGTYSVTIDNTVTDNTTNTLIPCSFLCVGGGGGGGSASDVNTSSDVYGGGCGGGGGGQWSNSVSSVPAQAPLYLNGTYTIIVGANGIGGSNGSGTSGSLSSIELTSNNSGDVPIHYKCTGGAGGNSGIYSSSTEAGSASIWDYTSNTWIDLSGNGGNGGGGCKAASTSDWPSKTYGVNGEEGYNADNNTWTGSNSSGNKSIYTINCSGGGGGGSFTTLEHSASNLVSGLQPPGGKGAGGSGGGAHSRSYKTATNGISGGSILQQLSCGGGGGGGGFQYYTSWYDIDGKRISNNGKNGSNGLVAISWGSNMVYSLSGIDDSVSPTDISSNSTHGGSSAATAAWFSTLLH
jgi:hypothetical protein